MGNLTSEDIIFIKENVSLIRKDGQVKYLDYIFNQINKLNNEVLKYDNSDLLKKE